MAQMPENIGRYKIIEILGKGAMGVVYKALDPNIDRIIAIKAIPQLEFETAPEGDEMKQRFQREIHTAGLLTHSNIVTVYDGGQDGDLNWIAMEYVDGPSLHSIIAEGPEPGLQEIVSIMAKVCAGIDFAHRRGVIHRDLKPGNILLTSEWEPKIADFGIARIESSTMTKTGVILGTPSYMSPEQVTGQRVDYRSDIFSLGIILYELCTGERPFTGENPTSIMYKIVHSDPPNPSDINPTLPAELGQIVMAAMAKRPKERYSSAGAMGAALLKMVGEESDLSLSAPIVDMETTSLDAAGVKESFDRYQRVSAPGEFEERRSSVARRLFFTLLTLAVIAGAAYGGWWWYTNYYVAGNGGSAAQASDAEVSAPLTVTANAEGARVLVNGEDRGAADGTSINLTGVVGTEFEIRVEADCYEPLTRTIVLTGSDPMERSFELQPLQRTLTVVTEPEGAMISLNGEEIGAAPQEVQFRCGEEYTLSATAPEYTELSRSFTWDTLPEEGQIPLTLEAQVYGTVKFSAPYRVDVFRTNGRIVARDASELRLRPGTYTFNLTNEDVFLNIEKSFEVKGQETVTVELPKLGELLIFAQPYGCTVTVNGFELNERQLPRRSGEAVAGTYPVVFDWGTVRREYTVTVEPGQTAQVLGKRDEEGNGSD